MKVSVVIPVFRRQHQVNHALLSLADEATLIDEVIVVDDCSPEPIALDIPDILAGRVKCLRLPSNLGAAGARQAGVDESRSDLVAFLDSDDAWLPGKLAAQLPLLRAGDPMLAVVCGWQDVPLGSGREPRTRIPRPSSDPADFASGCWFCPGSTAIMPRDLFQKVGPFDRRLRRLEDLDWFLRFALAGGRLEVADVCGALVAWERRSNFPAVDCAAQVIDAKFVGTRVLDPIAERRLGAWLEVERARAFWTTKRWWQRFPAAMMMASSQIRWPRRHLVQMDDWWTIRSPRLPGAEARLRLGL
ncbi:glycosyltransferase family 2 protein [Bosea massiliensis]|uniref:Glycosyltransferase family 2 protein n=1 Tax=Bosea massiliensis TaxID=151419 RepID=A0ABW0P5P6_9HYPH